MITAVAFDLDGTLIDSTDAIVESFFHTFDALGIERPPRDAIVTSIGHTIEDQFAHLGAPDPIESVRVYRAHYAEIACDMTTLLPGAREGLHRLQDEGLRLGFATSKKLEYAELILRHQGILDLFESRIGPDEVSRPKPHPEAVLKSLEHLDATKDEMFFVGDTQFDVNAAHAAGVRCLCVTTGYDTRDELTALAPEAVFDTLAEITAYILEHRNGRGRPGHG